MTPTEHALARAALVLVAYVLTTWPAGQLVSWLMRRWATANFPTDEGTQRVGRHIGYVERIIMVTFVLGGHYDAVGLLIAAKSILRVSDERARQQTEYILLGTLLSVAAALLLAMATRYLRGILGLQP